MKKNYENPIRRITIDGIRLIRNWYYFHENMTRFTGRHVEVFSRESGRGWVFVGLPNGQKVKARLRRVKSLGSKKIKYTDYSAEQVEIFRNALDRIVKTSIGLDGGIPMREIAKKAIREANQISILHDPRS